MKFSGPRASRIVLGVVLVLVVAGGVVFSMQRLRQRHQAEVSSTNKEFSDLHQLMRSGLHQEFTFLSFTIWHDKPLNAQKMDAIAGSAENIRSEARAAAGYSSVYKEGWNEADAQFFKDSVQHLDQVAEELQSAARKHDQQQVVSLFEKMDNTCQSCHTRFRPELTANVPDI